MNRVAYLRLALVILAGVVLQVAIVSNVRVAGMHPEIIWLFPVFAGLVAGSQMGAITGFASGIALDCLQPTPFGLTALVATILGFAVGSISERNGLSIDGASWWVTPLLGAGTSILGVALYGLLGFVFGEDQFAHINYLALLPVVAVASGLLAIPAWFVIYWSLGEQRGKRRVHREVSSW